MMPSHEWSGLEIESERNFRTRASRFYGNGNSQFAIAEDSIQDSILRSELKEADERRENNLERETGFEPATSTLARSHSTTELLPLATRL